LKRDLRLETHQSIVLPDGKYLLIDGPPQGTWLLQSLATDASWAMTERQLVTMLSDGVAQLIDPPLQRRRKFRRQS
jgi:hypothetical protein